MTATARRLRMEHLEGRDLCAGNVSATVSGGNLIVTGDSAANGLYIRYLGGTSYELESRSTGLSSDPGTKINGYGKIRLSGVTGDLRVNLGDGIDNLQVSSNVRATAPHLRHVLINMGTGQRENVLLSQTWMSGDLSIDAGSGQANVQVGQAGGVQVGGSMSIVTGGNNDNIEVAGTKVQRDLTISSGSGDDRITLANQPVGPVRGGGRLRLDAGYGHDRVVFTGIEVGVLDLLLGEGNDTLSVTRSKINGGLADGGSGRDSLTLGAGNQLAGTRFVSFESGNVPVPANPQPTPGNYWYW